MMKNKNAPRILVVGLGLSGLCTGYYLVKSGFTPIFVGERNLSASMVGQGLASIRGLIFPESDLFSFKIQGMFRLKNILLHLNKCTGLDRFSLEGFFEPYRSEEEYQSIIRRVHRLQWSGAYYSENLGKNGLPNCLRQGSYVGALYFPGDIWVDQKSFLKSLEGFLKCSGCTFVEDSVLSLNPSATESGSSVALRSGRDLGFFDHVILCCGPKINQLLNPLGLGLDLKESDGSVLYGSAKVSSNFGVLKQGKSLVCFNKEFFAGAFSGNEASKGLLSEFDCLGKYFDLTGIKERKGTRVRSLDRKPLLKWRQLGVKQKIWVLSGMYKSGLQLAPYCGDLLAHWILEKCAPTAALI